MECWICGSRPFQSQIWTENSKPLVFTNYSGSIRYLSVKFKLHSNTILKSQSISPQSIWHDPLANGISLKLPMTTNATRSFDILEWVDSPGKNVIYHWIAGTSRSADNWALLKEECLSAGYNTRQIRFVQQWGCATYDMWEDISETTGGGQID